MAQKGVYIRVRGAPLVISRSSWPSQPYLNAPEDQSSGKVASSSAFVYVWSLYASKAMKHPATRQATPGRTAYTLSKASASPSSH